MPLPFNSLLDVLWALDEETRLRIVALLQHGELSVSDLTEILGQSQPRISRHLKLLGDAGVVDKHREGTWAFFDLVSKGPIGRLVGDVLAATDEHDSVLAADLDRLTIVRSRRAAAAHEYFAGIAGRWDQERSLHASDDIVEGAIIDLLPADTFQSFLDIGPGTGRILPPEVAHTDQSFLDIGNGPGRIVDVLGLEPAHLVRVDSTLSMLAVAR